MLHKLIWAAKHTNQTIGHCQETFEGQKSKGSLSEVHICLTRPSLARFFDVKLSSGRSRRIFAAISADWHLRLPLV